MTLLEILRLQPDDRLAFLKGFLRDPQAVGSVVPSSRFLERRILRAADLAQAEVVVELGPGTGGTTRAILAAMPRNARLVCFELDPHFAEKVARIGDPRLHVHRGSAADIGEVLAARKLKAADVVISGIPFSTMPEEIGATIAHRVHEALAPGGRFVAYQFRPKVAEFATPVFGAPSVSMEPINVPPMRVFRWTKTRTSDT